MTITMTMIITTTMTIPTTIRTTMTIPTITITMPMTTATRAGRNRRRQ